MPLLVLDPIVLVNTAKSPTRTSAKLLTLLAYGAVRHDLDVGAAAEAAAMRDKGTDDREWRLQADRAYRDARKKCAELERSIPPGADGLRPDTYRMGVSRELLDCVVRRVGELREKRLAELDGGLLWGALVLHASEAIMETWGSVPDYTGRADHAGNVSIHTALRVGADMLVTKNPAVCGDVATTTFYSFIPVGDEPRSGYVSSNRPRLVAVHLDWLVQTMLREDGFDLEQVDATVLERIAPRGECAPRSYPQALFKGKGAQHVRAASQRIRDRFRRSNPSR